MIHKSANALKYGRLSANISETESGEILFSYTPEWLSNEHEWISISHPFEAHKEPIQYPDLPPFFDGLIPEGWLLSVALKLKPDLARDRFDLLLATGLDCVGAVSVVSPTEPAVRAIIGDKEQNTNVHVDSRENPFNRCLVCMEPTNTKEGLYHAACAQSFFGHKLAPDYNYFQDEFEDLARKNIEARLIVPGAQRKISASLVTNEAGKGRITVMGTGSLGQFIVKPEHPQIPTFPVNEHLAMTLSRVAGIPTAECALLLGPDGKLAYITKRFDRELRNGKLESLAMEDFGQIFGRTRDSAKYKESFNKIGGFLREKSKHRLLDVTQLFGQVFLSYLIGNNDFHLRNISVFTSGNVPRLTPAYDVTITQLIDAEPDQDLTLPIMGKRANLKRSDWIEFGNSLGLNAKAVENRFAHFQKKIPAFLHAIENSLLPDEQKSFLRDFITRRIARIG
jgi:serine/threonine-protein kinase HipA